MEGTGFIEEKSIISALKAEIRKVIIGQEYMVERILIGLLTGGHILVEGVPGLAKSLTASTVAKAVGIEYRRIQFPPDLLPADIVCTEIYKQSTGEFVVKKGPIFANNDPCREINRVPQKVQSALLEGMQEKQVTIGEKTYVLDKPFLSSPLKPPEQQGTYPLPKRSRTVSFEELKIGYRGGKRKRIASRLYRRERRSR